MAFGKKEEKILFLWGLFAGFLCFLLMFGVKVLDVTYDAWIFYGDIDLRQHYLGWCHFRTSDWHFPLGMIDSLSYPHSVSVIWTDAIPLFALFFKIFREILPETFQYLGLFTFLSFGMQGGLSAVLLRRVTDKRAVCVCGVFPFILSFPILQRCFYHTALSAQWLILLALYLWLSDAAKGRRMRKVLLWGGMSALCVLIHSYFIPMTALIMTADFVEDYVKNREWKSSLWGFGSFVVSGLFTLFALGAFSGSVNTNYGIGGFGCNLNTFLNPLQYGGLFQAMPLASDFQYEGYGYLGAGILFLLAISGAIVLCKLFVSKKAVRYFVRYHRRFVIAGMLFFVFLAAAMYPELSWNETMFFSLPVPGIMNKVLGFFRSNGRFIMPAVYLLMLFGFAVAGRYLNRRTLYLMMTVVLVLQAADVSKLLVKRQKKYNGSVKEYQSELLEPRVLEALSGFRHFVMMYDDVTDIMDVEYCAYRLSITNNRFYYARDIDAQVEESLEAYRRKIVEGNAESDCIFVFNKETYGEMQESGLNFYEVGPYIIGTKEPLPGF
ncbi:hypothetical protein D7X88_01520 [bacterium C-53]|nr:hypothetical protein [Lachnospiraceae bacterium]NBI01700.1 hypothetical protein [Lachnospiraceae bacterium]RKJ12989.1 hypothetical protein D7X88_01520 [bacterium C-53]